jgi:DNA repair exonuclease SbcCD ATPase subunit
MAKPVFDAIQEENKKLRKEAEELRKENHDLLLHYKEQSGRLDIVLEENHSLRVDCKSLHEENAALKLALENLRLENESLKQRVDALASKFEVLEKEVSKISLREAMRILEKYVASEVLGSKNQMIKRQLYTVVQLKKAAETDIELQEKLNEYYARKLNSDDLDCLTYFKKTADDFVHDEYVHYIVFYSNFTFSCKRQAEELLLVVDEDETLQATKVKLVNLLSEYCKTSNKSFGKF